MDILAELGGLERQHGIRCAIVELRESNPEMAEQLDRAIASKYNAMAISRWFEQHDISISDQVIRNHRLKRCKSCRTT